MNGAREKVVKGVGRSINGKVDVIRHPQLRGIGEGMLHSLQRLCTAAGRQRSFQITRGV